VHRDGYHVAEEIYIAEVGPQELADLIIDKTDFARSRTLRRRPRLAGGGRANRTGPSGGLG
jgi:hypothetical protein